ncbi:uncharacterized protein GGS25DRAFT_451562 [Hypoxylon fragiforme]|uniref:uncharacterized protein n=1 Tax=Hypoxylon fragiforme TaxID=63214 RepID=UPI0020C69E50|nr:uncharacterized protein GGS25DRAFT_451562 [Hypoxylon fragiforme]KAI2604195.1 hypothetical protein GGS25DRAFT_451562 [Hypoxylon fragiforme]
MSRPWLTDMYLPTYVGMIAGDFVICGLCILRGKYGIAFKFPPYLGMHNQLCHPSIHRKHLEKPDHGSKGEVVMYGSPCTCITYHTFFFSVVIVTFSEFCLSAVTSIAYPDRQLGTL